jgi:multiple sugar transport system permease protein
MHWITPHLPLTAYWQRNKDGRRGAEDLQPLRFATTIPYAPRRREMKDIMNWSLRRRDNISGYLFILPSIVFFSLFVLFPFLYSFYLSLHRWNGGKMSDVSFAGLEQYGKALHSPEFWSSLSNTAYYTFGSLILHLIFGLTFAVFLNQKFAGRTFLRAAYFAPVVMSTIVVGVIWRWIYSPETGLLNYFLSFVGIPPIAWLGNPNWAMPSIILMSLWKWVGFHMVIYLAALQGIPKDLYESASIDGASNKQKFLYITFPMLSSTTWFLAITSVINSFQIFDQIYVMTGGGPLDATNVVVYYIYKSAFLYYDMPYASAIAWLLFLVIFAVTMLQMKFARSDWQ